MQTAKYHCFISSVETYQKFTWII